MIKAGCCHSPQKCLLRGLHFELTGNVSATERRYHAYSQVIHDSKIWTLSLLSPRITQLLKISILMIRKVKLPQIYLISSNLHTWAELYFDFYSLTDISVRSYPW